MATETASRKPRGRPPVFSDEELRHAARHSYARRVRTRRGAQDLVYRKFAIAALELYRESFPEKASRLDWLFEPSPRHSLLSELGRVAQPRSNEQGELQWSAPEVSRLVRAAFVIAHAKPTTKAGIAMLRDLRRRDRLDPS
ncbi:hypothetical protein BH09ACT13_BH09ACT13_12130 [soil metagenome]